MESYLMLFAIVIIIIIMSASSELIIKPPITNYHHMQMIMQWPPTFCGRPDKPCKPSVNMSDFSIHGLWPGNATGHTPFTCTDPPNPTTVEQVWLNDRSLKNFLGLYWPSLEVHWTDEMLWKHEWKKHGYCTSEIVPDVKYFNGAITFARQLINMLVTLKRGGMDPSNNRAYNVTYMKTLISEQVLKDKIIDVYISCDQQASSSFVFLKQIHFCLDKSLNTFISCPKSTATRGCGRGEKQNLIFPTRVRT
ncbi:hypothetical protein MTR67_021572 [Solanum verrucosum]|uniref:Uncharacterized protein n=1 Tax=Solanum verrucosum TaxID=315347 RepID=A0AAF0QT40_SOLVR|nr:hypothetical protein MTR67_021572 [Solanum verrucosum]